MRTLTEFEFACICALAAQAATLQGEDAIGALLKIGGFRGEESNGVAHVARLIEEGDAFFVKMRQKKLDELKFKA